MVKLFYKIAAHYVNVWLSTLIFLSWAMECIEQHRQMPSLKRVTILSGAMC